MTFYMQERFGGWQIGNDPDKGAVEFKVFYPNNSADPSQYDSTGKIDGYGDPKIISIQVVGDFQQQLSQTDWDVIAAPQMTKRSHSKGTVWSYTTPIELTKGFYEYQYHITFTNGEKRIVSDIFRQFSNI